MNYLDISPAELSTLGAEPSLVIFDTRDPASYARGHLEGAIPVSDAALRQLMKARQPERPILVYCYRGNSSRDMCQFIAGMGFTRIYNLAGGWQAWEAHLAAATASARAPDPTTSSTPGATPSPTLAAWMTDRGFPADDIHARVDQGMSPLMLASLEGLVEQVSELLSLGADPNHLNDDDHHALWFACVHGDADLVERLIAHGGNVDNQNVNGATCAIYAASTGKLAVLTKLVAAGADLSKETSGGYTALDSASTLPVLKYLRKITEGLGATATVST